MKCNSHLRAPILVRVGFVCVLFFLILTSSTASTFCFSVDFSIGFLQSCTSAPISNGAKFAVLVHIPLGIMVSLAQRTAILMKAETNPEAALKMLERASADVKTRAGRKEWNQLQSEVLFGPVCGDPEPPRKKRHLQGISVLEAPGHATASTSSASSSFMPPPTLARRRPSPTATARVPAPPPIPPRRRSSSTATASAPTPPPSSARERRASPRPRSSPAATANAPTPPPRSEGDVEEGVPAHNHPGNPPPHVHPPPPAIEWTIEAKTETKEGETLRKFVVADLVGTGKDMQIPGVKPRKVSGSTLQCIYAYCRARSDGVKCPAKFRYTWVPRDLAVSSFDMPSTCEQAVVIKEHFGEHICGESERQQQAQKRKLTRELAATPGAPSQLRRAAVMNPAIPNAYVPRSSDDISKACG